MVKDLKGTLTNVVISLCGISCCAWILALNSVWVPTGANWPLPWVVLSVTFIHLRVGLLKKPFHP